jgi:uncharacterized protein
MKEELSVPNPAKVIAPPFTAETAVKKVRQAEDGWNSRDPARVALAYTEDSVWRNRSEFIIHRQPHRRAFPVRVARRYRPMAPQLRQ